MSFQGEPGVLRWRVHFASPPEAVFDALATAEGRQSFWADSAAEQDGVITFVIGRYPPYRAAILARDRPRVFSLRYFDTHVLFELEGDGTGGTDLLLTARGIAAEEKSEFTAGWVSVLLNMKAAVDFGVDLRNHDERRTWLEGYADN